MESNVERVRKGIQTRELRYPDPDRGMLITFGYTDPDTNQIYIAQTQVSELRASFVGAEDLIHLVDEAAHHINKQIEEDYARGI